MMQSELLQKIECDVANGKPAPEDLTPPETMLYYMLMGVYASYQSGKITKEQGHDLKKRAYSTYNRFKNDYEQYISICREYQQRLRNGYAVSGVTILPEEAKHESKSIQDGISDTSYSTG